MGPLLSADQSDNWLRERTVLKTRSGGTPSTVTMGDRHSSMCAEQDGQEVKDQESSPGQ
jgi:hypothetical protein